MGDFKYLTSEFTYLENEALMTPWIPLGASIVTGKRKRSYSTSDLPFHEAYEEIEQECKRKKLNDGSRSRETTPETTSSTPYDIFASSPASSFTIHNDSDSTTGASSPITPDLLEENWSSYFEFNKFNNGISRNEKERAKKISKRRERKKRENSKENMFMGGRSNSFSGVVLPVAEEVPCVEMVRVPLSPKYNDPAFTRPLNQKLTRRTTWGWNPKPTGEVKVQKHKNPKQKQKARSMSDSGILLIYRSLSDITGNNNNTTATTTIYTVEPTAAVELVEPTQVDVLLPGVSVDDDAALMLMGLGEDGDEEVTLVAEPDEIYHSSSEDEGVEGMDTDDEMMLEEELDDENDHDDHDDESDDDDDL